MRAARMRRGLSAAALLLSAALALLPGCGVDSEARIDPALAPSGPVFRPVSQMLVDRCGSMDCHGSKYRNLRLFGFGSGRLDPSHRPDAPETTPEEADRNYEAVVAVEPEVFRQVVLEAGREPERLTFVRKSRGAEAHKGGQRIAPGDAADECLKGWLRGVVDAKTCVSAVPRLAEP